MIEYYMTVGTRIEKIEEPQENCWIKMTAPTLEEINEISLSFNVDKDFIEAALDDEEISYSEKDKEEDCSIVTINVPKKKDELTYQTLPLAIITTNYCTITVCLKQIPELEYFTNLEKEDKTIVLTNLKTKFALQILRKVVDSFTKDLRAINKKQEKIESELRESFKNDELYKMLDLEKSTVYFATALESNATVLNKLKNGQILDFHGSDDEEDLDDVIIENNQALAMCQIYRDILSGTMDAFASIISNNLSIVMKFLTIISIVLAVPTCLYSFFGMNYEILPFNSFPLVLTLSIFAAILAWAYLQHKRYF